MNSLRPIIGKHFAPKWRRWPCDRVAMKEFSGSLNSPAERDRFCLLCLHKQFPIPWNDNEVAALMLRTEAHTLGVALSAGGKNSKFSFTSACRDRNSTFFFFIRLLYPLTGVFFPCLFKVSSIKASNLLISPTAACCCVSFFCCARCRHAGAHKNLRWKVDNG